MKAAPKLGGFEGFGLFINGPRSEALGRDSGGGFDWQIIGSGKDEDVPGAIRRDAIGSDLGFGVDLEFLFCAFVHDFWDHDYRDQDGDGGTYCGIFKVAVGESGAGLAREFEVESATDQVEDRGYEQAGGGAPWRIDEADGDDGEEDGEAVPKRSWPRGGRCGRR